MADNTIEVEVQANVAPAEKSLEGFKSFADQLLGSITPAINIVAINQGIELAKKAYEVLKRAVEVPLEIILDAEKVRSISVQFDLLSQQSGLIGEKLKSGLEKAAGGLADTTDLLSASNKAFIQLGSNASKLPEILELSRKATLAFGGDLISNFEQINQAIATGNVRSLRSLGLSFDKEAAEKSFARSLGVSTAALNEQGRQAAALQAVLEKSTTSFKNINGDALQVTSEFLKLKASTKELGESIAEAFTQVAGPAIQSLLSTVRDLADSLNLFVKSNFGSEVDKNAARIKSLEKDISGLNAEISRIENDPIQKLLNPNTIGVLGAQLDAKTKQLKALKDTAKDLQAQAEKEAPEKVAPLKNKGFVDLDKAEADRLALKEIFQKSNSDRVEAQLQIAQAQGNQAAIQDAYRQQEVLAVQQAEIQKDQVKQQFKAKGIIDESQYADVLANIEVQKNARILLLEQKALNSINEIQKALRTGVVQGLTSAFAAFGGALAKGANAFQAFSSAIIGAIGQVAIQIGSMLVAVGLGFGAAGAILPGWAVAGAGTVAAGLALIALGGALSALGTAGSGGGAETGAGTSGGGSGFSSADGLASDGVTARSNLEQNATLAKGTQVNVNVEGNVFNQRDTGLEIAKILQDHFDVNGNVIANGAVA